MVDWPADGFFVACKLFPEARRSQVSPPDIAQAEELVHLLGEVETLGVDLGLRHCWSSQPQFFPSLSLWSLATPGLLHTTVSLFTGLLGDKWQQLLLFSLQLYVQQLVSIVPALHCAPPPAIEWSNQSAGLEYYRVLQIQTSRQLFRL